MPGQLYIQLDMSECNRMLPLIEEALDSGLLTLEEAVDAIAAQARILRTDGTKGRTLGELLELKHAR